VTNVLAPIPEIKRSTDRPTEVLTNPVNIVGTPHTTNRMAFIHLAPYMSLNNPVTKRVITAPATEQIELVQSCSCDNSNDICISPNKGAMANHDKKAKKKESHAKWKAHICGRAMLKIGISTLLSSWD